MSPDAPKPERSGEEEPAGAGSARQRAESLTAKKSTPGADPKSSGDKPKPVLTEKQRIEARRARQERPRRRPQGNNPLAKGWNATWFEIRRTAAFLGSSIIAALGALGPVFSSAGMGLVWLLEQGGRALKAIGRLLVQAAALVGRTIVAVDRVVTPHRALILIAALGAILLGISQYKGLGQIEIGQPGYTGIEDLARAPAMDKTTPAGVHTQILVPIAAVAFAAVMVIALGGVSSLARGLRRFRRLASMVLITVGLLTLIVALLVDLPEATDTTEAALAYADVRARLLSGFWLELAAGASLSIAGLALLLEPAPASTRARRVERRTRNVDHGASAVNGGRA